MFIVETAAIIWMILLIAVAAATAVLAVPRRPTRAATRPAGAATRPAVSTSAGPRAARRPADPSPTDPRAAGRAAGSASGRATGSASGRATGRASGRVAARVAERAGEWAAELAAESAAAQAAELAAEHAAETARRRREEWLRAQDEVDATWAAFDAADREARRAAAAAAFPILKQRRTRAELADRERNLHRMATAACRRRELSIAQLNEALAHRGGWNPRRHPVAQEAALRAAVREHRYAAYQAATGQERQAWQEAEQAAATLRSLRVEMLTMRAQAGRDVHYERQWAPVRSAEARLAAVR